MAKNPSGAAVSAPITQPTIEKVVKMPTALEQLAGMEYVSTDGKYRFAWNELHVNTLVRALTREANHVYGNESIAPASSARKKNPDISDSEYNGIVLNTRDKRFAEWKDGSWGEGRASVVHEPGATRDKQIFNMLLAAAVRETVAKSNDYKTIDGKKDVWLFKNGKEYDLAHLMGSYLKHPVLGAERKAGLEKEAADQLAHEKAKAAARKARKERESKGSNGGVAAEGDEPVL